MTFVHCHRTTQLLKICSVLVDKYIRQTVLIHPTGPWPTCFLLHFLKRRSRKDGHLPFTSSISLSHALFSFGSLSSYTPEWGIGETKGEGILGDSGASLPLLLAPTPLPSLSVRPSSLPAPQSAPGSPRMRRLKIVRILSMIAAVVSVCAALPSIAVRTRGMHLHHVAHSRSLDSARKIQLASISPRYSQGPAKRGCIVAATLVTWLCFSNVDSFCHARNIRGGHKRKCFWQSSETFFVSARRATMLPRFATDGQHRRTQCCRHSVSSFFRGLVGPRKQYNTTHPTWFTIIRLLVKVNG